MNSDEFRAALINEPYDNSRELVREAAERLAVASGTFKDAPFWEEIIWNSIKSFETSEERLQALKNTKLLDLEESWEDHGTRLKLTLKRRDHENTGH